MHEATDIELIHTKFLRRILGVKKSTNLTALDGELGRFPLLIIRKLNMIKYWIKILKENESSLLKKVYMMLWEDTDINLNYNGKNWASQIKTILQQHGFEYIWQQQFDIDIPFRIIKQRVYDTYLQKWYSDINNSARLKAYSVFKHTFEPEKYLNVIPENKYKIAMSRFRISSHSLNIETGRYDGTPRKNRICKLCTMNKVEDEYHFLLVCPHYRELRSKYFKPYFCHWPTMNKFESLLSTLHKKTIRNVAKFIYFANKKRFSD